MFVGDFERAWRESDFIAAAGAPDSSRLRDGNPWLGRRIILRCLHGYGDAIQFIRYAPMLRRDAASLIIETHPEMVSTLRRAEGVDEIVSWGSAAPPIPPRWDAQIEIMELPRAFRTTAATIPRRLPYLTADPERAERARLMFDGTRLPKIGIVWASSGYNPARNIPLRQLTPILADRRFAWFSLQHGAERDDLRMVNAAAHVRDMAPLSPEIADTAAIMANLDLIITVDGVAAHLAGALARPVWTLLPYQADWRWMVDRNDSPWYPTMRLFRQSAPGNWRRAIGELVELLERFRHRFEFPSLSNGN
ncbi:MAG TPA: hypothetical protein VJ718_04105 [Candidatus Binataceae bacterium]|nr:hypothetical protein [Candidatus Binataceae bacterium]